MFCSALQTGHAYESVITDLGMPGIDGHQVARSIKTASPNTPVVMLTGWGAAMKEDGEKASEVDAVIGKPARVSELHTLLLKLTAPKTAPVLASEIRS
jgi:CheY-like chemotaxis protein